MADEDLSRWLGDEGSGPDGGADTGEGSSPDGTDADSGDRSSPDGTDADEADSGGGTDAVGASDPRGSGRADPGAGRPGGESTPGEPATRSAPGDPDPDPVELGVSLLEHLEHAELSVAEAIDRIEAITTAPSLQREILEEAQRRDVVERDGTTIRPLRGAFVRFESQVVQRDGEFSCQRCGADLSTGHFVRLDPGEVGPYGSSCIRKVTGRE